MRVEQIYLSPGHNYFGNFGRPAGRHPLVEVDQVECVAGKGLVGDRFFDYKENYKGQVTFFSLEVHHELCRQLEIFDKSPAVYRRNIIVRGVELNDLIGRRFLVGEVEFEGTEECRPCAWMDQAFGSGAEALLKGRGGLRARVLGNGILRAQRPRAAGPGQKST